MADSMYEVLIKFGLDDKKAREAIERLAQVDKASASIGKKGVEANNALGDSFKKIAGQLGGMLAGYLSIHTVMGAITHSVNQYIQQSGTSETTSRRWLEATQQIEFATTSLGRSIATAVLPVYENIAKSIKEDIIPGLEQAIALTGKLFEWSYETAGGRKSEALELLKDIQENLDAPYSEYAKAWGTTLNQYQDVLGKDTYKLLAEQVMYPSEYARAQALYKRTGQTHPLDITTEAEDKAAEDDNTAFKAIQEYELMLSYKRQEFEANKAFENQQFRMQRDFDRQETYATEDFNRQRYRTLRDFNMQIQYSESEFYRQRKINLRDFNISLQRSEYDYNLSRKRATEDHNFSLKQIMLSGDALQYYYSQRQFNIDKARAEEDFQLQRKRSKEDFARSQNDQLVQYQISRAFQLKQFEISLEDQEIDFKIQRKRALEQYRIQQNDLYYNFVEQRRIRENAFRAQYERLQTDEERLAKLKQQFTQAEIDSFEMLATQGREFVYELGKYLYQLRQVVSGTDPITGLAPSYDVGGYTKPGPAYVHAGEFVLTAKTTKAVEKVARSNQLTQDSILQAMGGGGLSYVDNRQFSRGLTADEKITIKQELAQMVREAFG